MAEVPITIACGNYDRTKAIIDGRVKVEGCAVNYLPLYPEEIFHRLFKFAGVRRRRDVVLELHPHGGGGHLRIHRHSGLRVAHVPAFLHLCARRRRHQQARGSARQAHRPARISDHGGGLDARHAAARIRRASRTRSIGATAARRKRAATSARRSSRSRGSTSSRWSRTRRWSTCCATASSTRCSPRVRHRHSCAASRISGGCFPISARPSRPISRRPGCSRSCIWWASGNRWSSSIPGLRPASTRRSWRPRRWR